MKLILISTLALVAACGDDDNTNRPDAGPRPDAAPDATPDGPSYTPPTPFAVPLSAAGPDQLQSVTAGPDNTFIAAGFAAETVAGVRTVVVVKFTTTGPDTTFGGGDGIATTDVVFVGGAGEVGVGTQSDGKIIVTATTVDPDDADDRDIAVLRLNADGTPDVSFDLDGKLTIDLNTGHDNGGATLVGRDGARGVAIGADNSIFILGLARGEGTAMGGGPRLDTDFTVAKLSALGVPDVTFNGDGKAFFDITESDATPRGIRALAGGTVLVGGYANSEGVGSTQPVVFKLTALGAPDATWANGVFHEVVLASVTEVYNLAIHDTHVVTAGYGKADTAGTNDWVSLRFDLATGARDLTWGGTTNGAVVVDVSGANIGDNCRNAVALPGGKTALVGSTGPGNDPAQDAAFAILDANGMLDSAYGDGVHTFPLGANGNDQFWGGAVSGNAVAFVGYKGGGMTQTDTMNDDAYGLIVPLE
jgi:uncharacterized delta-60 repeat protein